MKRHEMLYMKAKESLKKIEEKQKKKSSEELKDCTFSPKLETAGSKTSKMVEESTVPT